MRPHSRARLLLLMILVSGAIASAGLHPSAAQSNIDAQNAADAAYFYSYLELIGDYNTEYDYIHPDARAVIPRSAVTGWFLDNYWPRQPQPATITDVQFVSWTWPVTGVTYPYAAEVHFTQVFWDGGVNTVENDVVRLVQDRNGIWRWFFGRSLEFVNQVISQYVPQAATTSYTGSSWIDSTANDLDAYWRSFFSASSVAYSSPRVISFDQDTLTGCGITDPFTRGAFYCGADRTIYLNVFQLGWIESNFSSFTAQLVIAHEWGHHVQNSLGLPSGFSSTATELQADCLAGSWARDVATRFGLSEDDLIAAVALLVLAGDSTHGAGTQRTKMFLDGFYDGSRSCFAA